MAESHRPQGISSEQRTVGLWVGVGVWVAEEDPCPFQGLQRTGLPGCLPGSSPLWPPWGGGPSHQDLSCHVAGTSRPEQKCLGRRARGGQRQEVRGNYVGENGGNKMCQMNTCPIESP